MSTLQGRLVPSPSSATVSKSEWGRGRERLKLNVSRGTHSKNESWKSTFGHRTASRRGGGNMLNDWASRGSVGQLFRT